ncbi:hypothetical protein QYE76_049639 [Lolium multiflorum]|uniref:Cobalamin-independent methionine synthase MetE C-terminal/archaeal domain-containing protein n=1 Tax=Lolium multiflorum TaxID=4521 RepID=A0AAD8WIK6_LOLMU|nr:hypothetical protein QYE76_049639 [Lolium multiflorum]
MEVPSPQDQAPSPSCPTSPATVSTHLHMLPWLPVTGICNRWAFTVGAAACTQGAVDGRRLVFTAGAAESSLSAIGGHLHDPSRWCRELSRFETCYQIALATKEVEDPEAGGFQVIHIDEAAVREGLPLQVSSLNVMRYSEILGHPDTAGI